MVYFVGAGAGAADLITVRGMHLLEQADAVIYAGSLVNPELLTYTKETCKIYNSARLTLEEIIQIMQNMEREEKITVRLHTGEPSIYGAVREQMDELDKLGISYKSCPGVSACFGAAASLNLEYTLPEISQSLIITRMEGKTKVPKKESIESFAAHGTSMAIYLSAGMIKKLSEKLIEGGYKKTTPAAIVYKATWDEEEAYICTVETLYEVSSAHNITKTALVLVGDIIKHSHYKKSKLYDANFSTAFREKGKKSMATKLSIISFTKKGKNLSRNLLKIFEKDIDITLYTKCKACIEENGNSNILSVTTSVEKWAEEQMQERNALLFIGACGIAVRAVASSLTDKLYDSPVLVIDENGKYIIPLLSGHIGGANELAKSIAKKTGAEPVITTATDINNKFAIDLFAKRNNLFIVNKDGIVKVSSKILEGKKITMSIEPGYQTMIEENLSDEVQLISYPPVETVDVVITSTEDTFDTALLLKPKEYIIGIGCKKGKSAVEIDDFIQKKIAEFNISITQIFALASIAQKSDEQGIIEWCQKERVPFLTYTAEQLQNVKGSFTESSFVKEHMGIGNVCERAALKACKKAGKIILPKCIENGITIAIAKREW